MKRHEITECAKLPEIFLESLGLSSHIRLVEGPKKTLEGDWSNHLSITFKQFVTSSLTSSTGARGRSSRPVGTVHRGV